MTDPDSDLRREVEGKMRQESYTTDAGNAALSVHAAVSVAVECVRVERERCATVADEVDTVEARGDTRHAQLGDASATRYAIVKAIRNLPIEPSAAKALRTMSDEARRICKSESVPQGPTEPPREQTHEEFEAQYLNKPSVLPLPKECGCGTTGCTEHLPREERCPNCFSVERERRNWECTPRSMEHYWHSRPQKCPTCKGLEWEPLTITEGELAYLCTDWFHPHCRPQKVTP